MLTWWQTLTIGAGIAGITAALTAFFSRLNERVKWERERQERIDQWQREERQRERQNRVQAYARLVGLSFLIRTEPIHPDRSEDLGDWMNIFYTVRLIATAPVRDAAITFWEAVRSFGISHDPTTGAHRNAMSTEHYTSLLRAERLFLIAARKELGIHQEGDIEEFEGMPVA